MCLCIAFVGFMSEAGTESSADQTGGGEEAGLPAPTGPAGSGE